MTDKSEKTVKVRYVGGVDEVDVRLPSGRILVAVQRNHQVQVSEEDAEALIGNPNWAEVGSKSEKET